MRHSLLTKDEIIDLLNKSQSVSKNNKKSDLNAVIKNIYACQLITDQEYEEIKDYIFEQVKKGEFKFMDFGFGAKPPKKEIKTLVDKITDKKQLEQFIKRKEIFSADMFDVWRF